MIQEITERLNVKIHIETVKLQVFKKKGLRRAYKLHDAKNHA